MYAVASGTKRTYKGWWCTKIVTEGIQPIKARYCKSTSDVWEFRDSEGVWHDVDNVKEFCKLNNLSYSTLTNLARSRTGPFDYKGWLCHKIYSKKDKHKPQVVKYLLDLYLEEYQCV